MYMRTGNWATVLMITMKDEVKLHLQVHTITQLDKHLTSSPTVGTAGDYRPPPLTLILINIVDAGLVRSVRSHKLSGSSNAMSGC